MSPGPGTTDFAVLETIAAEVVQSAAELIHPRFGSACAVRTKTSPTDVVTQTDLEAERLIREQLMARSPGSTIIGEEYDDQIGESGLSWIVDPLDGTVNFLYDLPVVAVSIAARIDNKFVAGAVADVLRGEVFSASLGAGSRRNETAIVASSADELSRSLMATGFSYDARIRTSQAETVARMLPQVRDIRCFGSAALNLCWVGCGRIDAFYESDLQIYDYAAGALIAAEAGAFVEMPSGDNADLMFASSAQLAHSLRPLIIGRDDTE